MGKLHSVQRSLQLSNSSTSHSASSEPQLVIHSVVSFSNFSKWKLSFESCQKADSRSLEQYWTEVQCAYNPDFHVSTLSECIATPFLQSSLNLE